MELTQVPLKNALKPKGVTIPLTLNTTYQEPKNQLTIQMVLAKLFKTNQRDLKTTLFNKQLPIHQVSKRFPFKIMQTLKNPHSMFPSIRKISLNKTMHNFMELTLNRHKNQILISFTKQVEKTKLLSFKDQMARSQLTLRPRMQTLNLDRVLISMSTKRTFMELNSNQIQRAIMKEMSTNSLMNQGRIKLWQTHF